MKLLKNVSLLSTAIMLCSCSSVMFPDTVDDSAPISASYIVPSQSLSSDQENVIYDDMATPTKTAEVKEEKASSYKEVNVKTNNEKLNKMLVSTEEADTANDNVVYTSENYIPSVNYKADTFYFDNGGANLDPSANSSIRKIAKEAKAHNAIITVSGHSSSRTRNTDLASHKLANFNASMKRAESVANALKKAGVPAKNIRVEALSDTAPAYLEVMPEGERLNRRAEVYISY